MRGNAHQGCGVVDALFRYAWEVQEECCELMRLDEKDAEDSCVSAEEGRNRSAKLLIDDKFGTSHKSQARRE